MREHASEPRDYEMMMIVTPTVAEEGLPAVVERVSGYITSQGGTVSSTIHENPWGRRRLAYQINDHRDAFYVLYRFIARGESVTEIEREIKLDESIIRYLVVRYDEMTEHEERAPRQQAEAPGGPSFRRPRAEGQEASEAAGSSDATATAESPAATAETPAATADAPANGAASATEADTAQPQDTNGEADTDDASSDEKSE